MPMRAAECGARTDARTEDKGLGWVLPEAARSGRLFRGSKSAVKEAGVETLPNALRACLGILAASLTDGGAEREAEGPANRSVRVRNENVALGAESDAEGKNGESNHSDVQDSLTAAVVAVLFPTGPGDWTSAGLGAWRLDGNDTDLHRLLGLAATHQPPIAALSRHEDCPVSMRQFFDSKPPAP